MKQEWERTRQTKFASGYQHIAVVECTRRRLTLSGPLAAVRVPVTLWPGKEYEMEATVRIAGLYESYQVIGATPGTGYAPNMGGYKSQVLGIRQTSKGRDDKRCDVEYLSPEVAPAEIRALFAGPKALLAWSPEVKETRE